MMDEGGCTSYRRLCTPTSELFDGDGAAPLGQSTEMTTLAQQRSQSSTRSPPAYFLFMKRKMAYPTGWCFLLCVCGAGGADASERWCCSCLSGLSSTNVRALVQRLGPSSAQPAVTSDGAVEFLCGVGISGDPSVHPLLQPHPFRSVTHCLCFHSTWESRRGGPGRPSGYLASSVSGFSVIHHVKQSRVTAHAV